MRIEVVRHAPIADRNALASITSDIEGALRAIHTVGSEFVVNDTRWLAATTGNPCVTNAAPFLSKQFLAALEGTKRWKTEVEFDGQRIDAFGTFQSSVPGWRLTRDDVLRWMLSAEVSDGEVPARVAELFQAFVLRSIYTTDALDPELAKAARMAAAADPIRVGVEFETGNIGSSFRSLQKLNLLCRLGMIDLGVFVTSLTKAGAAARIWPSSNRNGSFEELSARQWEKQVSLPLLALGFEPDGFSTDAPYLGADGTLYQPTPTGRRKVLNGKSYDVFKGPTGALWLRESV